MLQAINIVFSKAPCPMGFGGPTQDTCKCFRVFDWSVFGITEYRTKYWYIQVSENKIIPFIQFVKISNIAFKCAVILTFKTKLNL